MSLTAGSRYASLARLFLTFGRPFGAGKSRDGILSAY